LLSLVCALALRAAEDTEDKWHFATVPHLWAAGIDGDFTLSGINADLNIGFDQIAEHLEGGLMTYLELRKRKFGFYANPLYMKLTGDADVRTGGDADFEQQLWIVEFGGFYNLGVWGGEKPVALDVIAGGRYWNNHIEADFTGPIIGSVGHASTEDFIDPLVGLRANQHFAEKFSWSIRGDIGGFGVSDSSSDFSWQAMGLLGYDLSKKFSLWAGYRALALEKEDGNREYDLILHGPIIGLEIRF
jgi:opacity protein-like surface antigen